MRRNLWLTVGFAALCCTYGCDSESDTGDDPLVAAGSDGSSGESGETANDESGTDGTDGTGAGTEGAEDLEGMTCDTFGLSHACGDGLQFCAFKDSEEVLSWSTCWDDIACNPDELDDVCDDPNDTVCELSVNGVPEMFDCAETGGEESTPLVLSFSGAPVEYKPMRAAAGFDIDGEGRCDSHDWPTAATPWLAVDLDGSGTIDGGHELFGSGTVLSDGLKATDGFIALEEFDSNHDGQVSESDPRWAELVLWSDLDGDKRTDVGELEPLSAYGVAALPLAYDKQRECDGRRNCVVEQATFGFSGAGGQGHGRLVDVHLPCR